MEEDDHCFREVAFLKTLHFTCQGMWKV